MANPIVVFVSCSYPQPAGGDPPVALQITSDGTLLADLW